MSIQKVFSGDLTWFVECGHALDILKLMPSQSVHMIVTSPPYYRARSYGTEQIWGGQKECGHKWKNGICQLCAAIKCELGLEHSPPLFIQHLIEIFNEAWRVLRDDGTMWINIGDTYFKGNPQKRTVKRQPFSQEPKPKNLTGIPWRLAFALQGFAVIPGQDLENIADLLRKAVLEHDWELVGMAENLLRQMSAISQVVSGWWLRSDVIWYKRGGRPESITDRPTSSHEYVFLLSKSPRYYYDHEAVREPQGGNKRSVWDIAPGSDNWDFCSSCETLFTGSERKRISVQDDQKKCPVCSKTDAWVEHFAPFPSKLVETCILAGTSLKNCPHCGAPWSRVTKKGPPKREWQRECGGDSQGRYRGTARKDYKAASVQDASELKSRILEGLRERITVGWRPSCGCAENDGSGKPVVLDPFVGSGTTIRVAERLGRKSIGIDLNPKYCALSHAKMKNTQQSIFHLS